MMVVLLPLFFALSAFGAGLTQGGLFISPFRVSKMKHE